MKNIVIIGMKNSGKSTLAYLISEKYRMNLVQLDMKLEKFHSKETGDKLSFRMIYKKYGHEYFSDIENKVLRLIQQENASNMILDCGGGTPLMKDNRKILKKIGVIIFIELTPSENLRRILLNGIPAFFKYPNDPKRSFEEIYSIRNPLYRSMADFILDVKTEDSPDQTLRKFELLEVI